MSKKKKVPVGCWVLSEAIYRALKVEEDDTIEELKKQFQQAAECLDGLPDDFSLADIDISTDSEFSPQMLLEIRNAQEALRKRRKRN